MARQERPVDPAAGPLQTLAHELRKLRVEAGSPTYRALARRTGYSASTLSEAAAGKRKPTLDVLLAYVGALQGDADEWRERWEALESSPASLKSSPPVPAEPGSDTRPAGTSPSPAASSSAAGSAGGAAESGAPGRWRGAWRSGRTLTVAGLALVVLAGAAYGVQKMASRDEPAPAAAGVSGCPAARSGVFSARTYGSGTTIRQGPARVDRPLASVPAGCTLGLTGYCVGEPIMDSTAYTPDVRWFMVAGGGVVASATVHGNPPAGMGVSRCAGDRPLPSAITLRLAAHAGRVKLTASGPGVDVVGYAAYYAAAWHQIGLTGPGGGGFPMEWSTSGNKPIALAAAACLGGEAPTGVVDVRAYPAGGASRVDKTVAGQVACLYPVAK
jgi:transcriptional regulator with XRE-family HTH domain